VFSFFVVLAWVRPLPRPRRVKVTAIGAAGTLVVLAAFMLPRVVAPLAASVVRDWLPAALIMLVYWQAGAFFLRIDQQFQDRLERLDERIVGPVLRWIARRRARVWIAWFLELAYLFCYPMIPMSLGALYLLRLARHADHFWTVVLIPTYISYGLVPFLQALPPRMLDEPWLTPLPATPVRKFNLWILRHGSIHANTFPSAHVAAATAAALVLASLAPWSVALLFAVIAFGIGIATFAGRYHYAADSIIASLTAGLAFLLEMWMRS
jgi:membrane-associated phospholipid phosphatase